MAAGFDGSEKAHYDCPSLYDEAQLKVEFDRQQCSQTYDQWKQTYYQELQATKDGGGAIDVLAGD